MARKNSKLVIVESPSKIKTLKKFLGNDYIIEASVGHICDLSKKDMGVDIENEFNPTYEVSPNSRKVVANLRKVLNNHHYSKIELDAPPIRVNNTYDIQIHLFRSPSSADKIIVYRLEDRSLKKKTT